MSTTKNVPAYAALANAISAKLREMGVQLVPQGQEVDGIEGNKGWACWQHAGTRHKIYLSRAVTAGKAVIHTTLDLDPGTPGYLPAKENGKIAAHFQADESLVLAHLLPLFAGAKEPLRADRRGASKPASSPAGQSPARDMGQEI